MNGSDLLIDTNIALYLLNGDQTVAQLLQQQRIFLSIISEIELLSFAKLTIQERKSIELFLDDCVIIGLSDEIKRIAIDLRRKFHLKIPDAIITATAPYLIVPLISADQGLRKVGSINLIYYQS